MSDSVTSENGLPVDVQLLRATDDEHGGIIVEMNKEEEAMDPHTFHTSLTASLSHWKQQGKKGVWIKLPIELVHLVETAVKDGFGYHHAEPTYLMLVHWIPVTGSTIPENASHKVVVGGVVLSSTNEILVVQEKIGNLRGKWKIPTGTVDEGEDLFAAVKREVKEETGIDTEFQEIVAFRQFHKAFFEKSTLFFLCMLRPLSFDIQIQELEIEAAQWMAFEEFAAEPYTQKDEPSKYIVEICLAKRSEGGYSGYTPVPVKSVFDNRSSFLYLNTHHLNNFSDSNKS